MAHKRLFRINNLRVLSDDSDDITARFAGTRHVLDTWRRSRDGQSPTGNVRYVVLPLIGAVVLHKYPNHEIKPMIQYGKLFFTTVRKILQALQSVHVVETFLALATETTTAFTTKAGIPSTEPSVEGFTPGQRS